MDFYMLQNYNYRKYEDEYEIENMNFVLETKEKEE